MVASADGKWAFVANSLDDTLSVYDVAQMRAAGVIDLGGPKEVTVTRRGERVFHSADIRSGNSSRATRAIPTGTSTESLRRRAGGIGVSPVDNRTLRGILDTAPFKWEGTNPTLSRQCGPRLAVFFTRLLPFTPEDLSALDRYVTTIQRPPYTPREPNETYSRLPSVVGEAEGKAGVGMMPFVRHLFLGHVLPAHLASRAVQAHHDELIDVIRSLDVERVLLAVRFARFQFHLAVRLDRGNQKHLVLPHDRRRRARPGRLDFPFDVLRLVRILVADDSSVFRRAITDALASIPDVEVVGSAANGKIALQKVIDLKPDLLTLDMEMPEMDGLAVLDALKQAGSATSVMVISAVTLRGGRLTMQALEKGAFDFLTKPQGKDAAESKAMMVRELAPRLRALAHRRQIRDILRPGASGTSSPTRVSSTAATTAASSRPVTARSPLARPEIVLIGVSTGRPGCARALAAASCPRISACPSPWFSTCRPSSRSRWPRVCRANAACVYARPPKGTSWKPGRC